MTKLGKKLEWVLMGFIGIIFLVSMSLFVQVQFMKVEIPNILGYQSFNVLTGSMKPTFSEGDMVIAKITNPNIIKENDILVYFDENRNIITHRVVSIEKNQSTIRFQTKGDANNAPDSSTVPSENIIGLYQLHIPFFGTVTQFAKTPVGLFLLLGIPSLFLIFAEIKKKTEKRKKSKPIA